MVQIGDSVPGQEGPMMFPVLCVFSACSEIIATSSKQDIRLWYLRTRQELVRITVPNHTCNAIAIMKDGKTIVSGKTSVICSVYVRAQKEDDMYSILDVAN